MGLFGKTITKDDKKFDDKSGKVVDEKKQSMKDLYTAEVKADKKDSSSKTVKAKPSVESKKDKIAYRVLLKPLITEKAASMGSADKYVFEVSIDSNKIEVANAVEEVYGIRPLSVNVIKMEGKRKRQGRKIGKRKDWKKAMVTLPKGKTIDIYEGV
jgi:large subunit ribosomal protein L23